MSRSGLWGPELRPSLSEIRHRVSSDSRGRPVLATAVARSYGIHAYRHAGEESLPRRVSNLEPPVAVQCDLIPEVWYLVHRGCLIPAARASPPRAGTR